MNLRLCPICRRSFPPGAAACPDHGLTLRDDALLGLQVGGYQVLSCLAEGLYWAIPLVALGPDAQVALRVLPAGRGTDVHPILDGLRDASARTSGIGVLPLDGGVLPDGRCYYLFPWSRQHHMEPLPSYLQRTPGPTLDTALQLSILLCDALEVAHQAGLYHGGLDADCVLLYGLNLSGTGPGPLSGAEVRLLDLGAPPAGPGATAGADPRHDVYAVGAILYQMATGTPLQAATAFAGPGADLPAEFQAVVVRAVAQRREDRHKSIAALRKDLLALLGEVGPRSVQEPARPQRGPVLLPLVTAAALLIAATASALLIFKPDWQPDWQPSGVLRRGTSPHREQQREQNREPPQARLAEQQLPAEGPLHVQLVPLDLRAQALDVLGEAQRGPAAESRRQAAQLIGQSGDRRLRPPAEELLADADERVAARAAWALGQLMDRAAVVALSQASGDEKTDLSVGVALLRLGDRRGLPLLRGLLRSKDDSERLEAALWLGEHGEQEAWRTLRRLLMQAQDQDPLRHLTILGRLCRGRDQAACQQLRERLTQKGVQGQARLLIGAGLMQAGDQRGYQVLHEAAKDGSSQRMAALRWLAEGDLWPAEEGFLLSQLQEGPQGSAAAGERAQAADLLGQAAAMQAVPALGRALADDDIEVRRAAAGALLRLSALEPQLLLARAADWAQAAVTGSRLQARLAATAVLGSAPPALAVPLLLRALKDREPEVRQGAALTLGELSGKAALPALSQALGDRDGTVRVAALRSLAHIDDPAATAMLKERLDRGPLLEQVAAAGVLLGKGDLGHRFVLQQAMQSPDVAVRRQALEQAQRDPDPVQRTALYAQGLADAADDVQLMAAVALARLGDRRGVPVLRSQSGLLLPQRLLARDALGRLKEPEPSLDIMAALGAAGEGQRAAAMGVAAELLPETGLSLVQRGLRDASPAVRQQAAVAASALAQPERTRQQLLLQVIGDPDGAVQARAQVLLARLLSAG